MQAAWGDREYVGAYKPRVETMAVQETLVWSSDLGLKMGWIGKGMDGGQRVGHKQVTVYLKDNGKKKLPAESARTSRE